MALIAADRARLAHRVLRLTENGINTDRGVRAIAAVPSAFVPKEGEEQGIGNTTGHPLGTTAYEVLRFLDEDLPGPTDKNFINDLFNRSHIDVWSIWRDAVSEHTEKIWTPKQLKEVRESQKRDQDEYEARIAQMEETGSWKSHPVYGHNHLPTLANALYDLGRQGFLDGSIDWDTANTKVALVDSAVYTVNLATHQFMSSVGSPVAATAAQASKTVTAGVADAADDTFTAVSGAQSEALIIYQASAVTGGADVANTSQRLIAYIDTATGLPVTPNGGNITVTWDNTSNRIFKL